MSVSVKDLSKHYGQQRAVDQLSFAAGKGEILGFLGPNGAGKSTTMKMITGYLTPDGGSISVNGSSPIDDPIAVKQMIGYLPEHNPLYTDLYVLEYLGIMSRIQNVQKPKQRVAEVVEMTGLERERRKKIGALSKGYRQRVGLAQAILHDPDVLILDEPTSGLDPNQLAEIRELIKSLGKNKTIIFSTHIMQEVQAICDRVVIIDSGKKVLDEPITFLESIQTGQSVVTVQFDRRVLIPSLRKIPGVKRVDEISAEGIYRIYSGEESDIRAEIFHFAVASNAVLLEMSREKRSVEDVFQHLTRK